jgi:hypothetical protein
VHALVITKLTSEEKLAYSEEEPSLVEGSGKALNSEPPLAIKISESILHYFVLDLQPNEQPFRAKGHCSYGTFIYLFRWFYGTLWRNFGTSDDTINKNDHMLLSSILTTEQKDKKGSHTIELFNQRGYIIDPFDKR